MPSIDSYRKSNYLQKGDVEPPILATISHTDEADVSMEGKPESIECIVHFKEDVKPLIAKITNLELIAEIAGDRNTDHWEGVQIVIYHDKNVMYGRKRVGGVRVCAPDEVRQPNVQPRKQQPKHDYGPPPSDDDMDPQDVAPNDIPF